VLVDADFEHCEITQRVGSNGTLGLADVVKGRATLGDVVRHGVNGVETLAVLGVGTKVSGHAADLFASAHFRKVLDELARQFDYVIVDSAAMLDDSGTDAIAPSMDGVVVVSRRAGSKMADLAECRSRLTSVDARVVGVVFFSSRVEPASEWTGVAV
jgi:Mrp family chromosome partitioning ATPase